MRDTDRAGVIEVGDAMESTGHRHRTQAFWRFIRRPDAVGGCAGGPPQDKRATKGKGYGHHPLSQLALALAPDRELLAIPRL